MYGQKVEIPDGCDNGEGSYLFQHEPTSDLSLAPSSAVVSFDDITIYRIGGGKILFMPFLFEASSSPTSTHSYSAGIAHPINHTPPQLQGLCDICFP